MKCLASFITLDRICRDDVFTTLVVGSTKACTTPTIPVWLYFLSVIFLLCVRCVCPMRFLSFFCNGRLTFVFQ